VLDHLVARLQGRPRPITLLAIGCVLFTTIAVAAVAHYFIPGFPWPVAFVLGAIISPPDAVAATAATKGLFVPRRVITVLEGESLVNDATGLIASGTPWRPSTTGQFVLWQAGLQFLLVAGGGILLGVTVGQVLVWVHKITRATPPSIRALPSWRPTCRTWRPRSCTYRGCWRW
jgi:CPA1 family monovalent cation:H+ antiporter